MIYIISIILVLLIALSARYNWWRLPQSYKKARVLMYHSISEHIENEKHNKWRVKPKDFEKQMKWFYDNKWNSFTISELIKLDEIPKKSFIVTFDDGYEDNFINAFPILKKYNFKATIYLVPNQSINNWEEKNTSILSNLLNNEQILQMQNTGLIEFGSHTLSHVNLSTINDEQLFIELKKSKEEIEKITKKECEAFAYPYGKFNDNIIQSVEEIGYKNATVVKRGLFEKNDNPFIIKRIGILGTESFVDFLLKVTRIRNKL
ncbi:MAG: polysaccharide deacetylase family protein [Aliarcobacter sp.]|jgi:peptidoglycan/xylan/chitin deacetylase (PgdA/CDA1 family)|nr:polysaccharide deacetylase family protein [Aliarcobacter sp.]